MKERIKESEIKEFLKDHLERSETMIFEEGKEKNDVLEVAKAKGIKLKNNTDLAGFKTIFTFADKANSNGARAPKEKLLKALPTMIGKPVDIDHDRRFVVGHYIDYSYVSKDDMVVAYGVFYKSNFGPEWEEAKTLFKAKKLSTSYEIWSPKERRKALEDGSYELGGELEIAGGGLMFRAKPAFKDAKVLELAKTHMEEHEKELIFASDSKYKIEDLITANVYKDAVEQNLTKLMAEKEIKAQTPSTPLVPRVACSNCQHSFETTVLTDIKCPKCFSILDSKGTVLYPPQIIDFRLNCPTCHISNWRLLSSKDERTHVKCIQCAKEYSVEFNRPDSKNEIINQLQFVYTGRASCPQCGNGIDYSSSSDQKEFDLSCDKCGLEFKLDRKQADRFKQIKKIEEYIETPPSEPAKEPEGKISEEGRPKKEMESKDQTQEEKVKVTDVPSEEKTVNQVKEQISEETPTKSSEDIDKDSSSSEAPVESHTNIGDDVLELEEDTIIEEQYDDGETMEKAQSLTTEKRKEIPDDHFAVVKNVKNKKTEEQRKIRMFPINDETHVRNALARLAQDAPKETLKKLGVSIETVEKKILKRAQELNMTDLLERHTMKVASVEDLEAKNKKLRGILERAITKIVSLKKASKLEKAGIESELAAQVEKIRKDCDEKIELYKANAQTVAERKIELGEFAKDLSDKDILNDDKYARVKVEMENAKLKAKMKTADSDNVVGVKKSGKDFDKLQKEIDGKAFGGIKRE